MLESKMDNTEVLPILHIGLNDHVFNVECDMDPVFKDDLTGQILDPVLVRAARKKELDFFEAKGVWVKRAMDEARRKTGKPPIAIRWVDVSKGDDVEPIVRSRLVARQIRQPGEEAIFVPTPRVAENHCVSREYRHGRTSASCAGPPTPLPLSPPPALQDDASVSIR